QQQPLQQNWQPPQQHSQQQSQQHDWSQHQQSVNQWSQPETTVVTENQQSQQAPQQRVGQQQQGQKQCNYCGFEEHSITGTRCPAAGKQCTHCLKLGHWNCVCKSKLRGLPPAYLQEGQQQF